MSGATRCSERAPGHFLPCFARNRSRLVREALLVRVPQGLRPARSHAHAAQLIEVAAQREPLLDGLGFKSGRVDREQRSCRQRSKIDRGRRLEFYRRNGYAVVSNADKEMLLRKYWSIPARQVETSVVLADARWRDAQQRR